MLVDAELGKSGIPEAIQRIAGMNPKKVGTGLYVDCGYNFHNCVSPEDWDDLYMFDDPEGDIPSYGVVDSVEQFIELFGEKLNASERQYAVGFTPVKKREQSESGGWRWGKWGEYYGVHEITTEYLYDEPDVQEVVTFLVMRKKTR